jgi:hypothetical protein
MQRDKMSKMAVEKSEFWCEMQRDKMSKMAVA